MIKVEMMKDVFVLDEKGFQSLNSKGFGKKNGQIYELEAYEVLYLLEKGKVEVLNKKGDKLNFKTLLRRTRLSFLNYVVYRDLKSKGYQVKSGLKYGFVFRVYDKGIKEGDDHSLWLVEPVLEKDKFLVKDFAGKNRVAHSTKKKMLFAIVDVENDVTYLEVNWKRV